MQGLTGVARSTLTSLAAYWLAFWAFAGAIDLLLDTTVDMVAVRAPLMVAWSVAAVALLAARFSPGRIRVPALLVLTVLLAVGTTLAREATGLVAPWLQVTVAAGMVATAAGFLASYRVLPLVAVLVAALLVANRADELTRDDSPVRLGVPLMEAVLVLAMGLLAAMIRTVLMQSAERADRAVELTRADALAAARRTARADAQSEQMSLLHDTALNTFAALSLGPSDRPEAQRRRCTEDADRLSAFAEGRPAPGSVQRAIDDLTQRSDQLGLILTVSVDADHRRPAAVPPRVVAAVFGAVDEALVNVAKHAGSTEVRVVVHVDADALRVSVSDDGLGFEVGSGAGGYGLSRSVQRRMQSVGGVAAITSAPGRGTTVALAWQASDQLTEPTEDAVSAVSTRLIVALLAATSLFALASIVAEWRAFERPWVAIGGALALGAWGLAVTRLLWHRRWIPTSIGVVTVALACVAPFWTIASDQYCSSTFGGLGWIDPRLPLIIMVMLTAGRWWRGLPAMPVFIVATVVAGVIWSQAFAGCGDWAITASIYAVVIFMAALIAGRTLNRQAVDLGQAQRDRDAAEMDSVRAAAASIERQRWFGPAVESSVPLLRGIGDGSLNPASEDVRRQCRHESGYLRGLVSTSAAPAGVRDGVWYLMRRAHDAGMEITVRGDLARLTSPPSNLASVIPGALLVGEHPGATMEITGLRAEGYDTLMVNVSGAPHPLPVPTQPAAAGIDVALDVDDDNVWMEIRWKADAAVPPAAASSGATSSHTPAQSVASL